MSEWAQKQPLLAGLRNERQWQEGNRLDNVFALLREQGRKVKNQLLRENARLVKAIIARSEALEGESEEALSARLEEARQQLRQQGITRATLIESFAVIREISGRVLGMRHHHTQIRASLAILRGSIAEMATGEGKTLAATLGAATAGLAGIPVHVVTVNDYLAERDAEEMIPLYEALGLTVGIVTHEADLAQRREAYACDLCYCSNNELTFDFLKDRLVLDGRENTRQLQAALLSEDSDFSERLLLRGLHFAIVDEADSVFVDEAGTPLIISGDEKFGPREEALIQQAMQLAGEYQSGRDFIQNDSGAIQILPAGYQRMESLCHNTEGLDALWRSPFYREPLIAQALSALHVYHLDQHYLVDEEGAVQIIDPYTGRVMPGRSWGQGLQQMIELKEGLELTKPRETNAEISYQNFFRKYHHLAGMTGTGKEVASEMFRVYRLRSENIPLLRKSRRQQCYREVFLREEDKWQRVAELVNTLKAQGQAILIGTNSLSSSEAISSVLEQKGITHQVLNARQDKDEANVVAQAGQAGAVMVATSMAGRGTDIKLNDASREAGGLHVIITELQDSSRVDRQLAGRSARQGDPGNVSEVLSFEDQLIVKFASPLLKRLIRVLQASGVSLPHWLGFRIQKSCQNKLEKQRYKQRMQMIKMDSHRQKTLAFAGDKH